MWTCPQGVRRWKVCIDQLTRWPRGWLGLALPLSPTSQWKSLPVWPQFSLLGNDENINLQSLYAAVRISSGTGG